MVAAREEQMHIVVIHFNHIIGEVYIVVLAPIVEGNGLSLIMLLVDTFTLSYDGTPI